MCQFKYTRHSCGHTLPKLENPQDPSCKLCVPVMVALKFYHDQVTQVCIENALQQPPLRMPKPCRPVAPNSLGEAEETARIYARDQTRFEDIMNRVGVNPAERSSIENLALRPNHTSKRNTNGPLRPVCPQHLWFMMELEVWQHRQFQPPNITFNTVSWGCGGTGPGVQGDCLVGWTGQGILMYRHGIWNVNPPHPSQAWSPLPVGYLYIDYGDAPVVKLPEVWRASATRTLIDIPMYKCLYAVLCGRPSGPLMENDEGHLVPALGASGPEIPIAPYFPPAPQLPASSGNMGQRRPPQAFVPNAHLRQGPRHRYSATWNSPAPIDQTAGGSKSNAAQKQRTVRTYKERYGHGKTDAGQDRAKITTKIKELPQRRASRSGNATPASTTSPRASQPLSSRHPTPGSTRPATPAGDAFQSDERNIGLGIIHESPPVASIEATNQEVEDTVLYQPPHHRIPQHHEAEASTSVSDGKKPIGPIPSRQTSTQVLSQSPHPTIESPSPPEDIPLEMFSNMHIGAGKPSQPSTQPLRPSTQPLPPSTTQPSHPHRPNLIRGITDSTSHMTQFTAQFTALQLQEVPGVTYTLNPTAEAFEPDRKSEGEADRRSED